MIIKKHSSHNEYYLTKNGLWVRNYTKSAKPLDINNLTDPHDFPLLMQNEITNRSFNLTDIGSEHVQFKRCIIVSDGYRFDELKQHLCDLPSDICVIGVNRSLAKWTDDGKLLRRKMNFFVINNPYKEAMGCMPQHGYRPKCIASSRTYPEFIKRYKGVCYQYSPVFEASYSGQQGLYYQIDDYRNPVCAAIGLAYRFGVQKLALFCCDDTFDDERPGAEQLENGLWMYPQHWMSHGLIEGSLYWLLEQEVDHQMVVVDCSHGPIYQNVPYIQASELKEVLA